MRGSGGEVVSRRQFPVWKESNEVGHFTHQYPLKNPLYKERESMGLKWLILLESELQKHSTELQFISYLLRFM